MLGRLEWLERVGDVGCGRENCWEIGRSGKEPESTRMCVIYVLGLWVGFALSGGSVGGVCGTRSSCRSVERRTSFRGERGDCGVCGECDSFISAMTGLDIAKGLSRFVRRRKIDDFLDSGAGCVVSTANMMSMCDPNLASGYCTLVQVQTDVGSKMVGLQVSKKRRRSSCTTDGVMPYISTSARRTKPRCSPPPPRFS